MKIATIIFPIIILCSPAFAVDHLEVKKIVNERVSYVEDDLELYKATRSQEFVEAFDKSNFAAKMYDDVSYIKDIMRRNEGEFRTFVQTAKTNGKKTAENAGAISVLDIRGTKLDTRVTKLELSVPILGSRVEKIEIRRAQRIEKIYDMVADIFTGLMIFIIPSAGIWWFQRFCKKRKLLSRLHRLLSGDDGRTNGCKNKDKEE